MFFVPIGGSNGIIHTLYNDCGIPTNVSPVSADDTAIEGEDSTSSKNHCWLYS